MRVSISQTWTAAALLFTSSVLAYSAPDNSSISSNILTSPFQPPQYFRNAKAVRSINLERSYARTSINIVVENISPEPQQEYFLPFEVAALGKVGGLEVRDKKAPENAVFETEVVGIDEASSVEYYKIIFPEPLPAKEQITLALSYNTLASLQPVPGVIDQNGQQYVLYAFSAYMPSAYKTSEQKTKLKLPTTDVPDATTVPAGLTTGGKQSPSIEGTTYTYGPFGEREAGVKYPVSVRYEFTKPIVHATLLERDVEVSHWGGNLATEERIWLTNRGATLKDNFSRVQWVQSQYARQTNTHALRGLVFPLLGGSADAYFVDDIGNVSTSNFKSSDAQATLQITPRYPLFGGWKYSFKVGWNNDLAHFVRAVQGVPDSFVFKAPVFEGPIHPEGIAYERVHVRIILPEGAEITSYTISPPLAHTSSQYLHHTFMDTLGRTTLELKTLNAVDESRVDRNVYVNYTLTRTAQWGKPISAILAVAAIFTVAAVVRRVDVRIGRGGGEGGKA